MTPRRRQLLQRVLDLLQAHVQRCPGNRIEGFLVALEMHCPLRVLERFALLQFPRGGAGFELVELAELRLAGPR